MAAIDITEAAFAGVRLLIRRPLSAIAWAVVYVGFIALILLAFSGSLIAMVGGMIRQGTSPDPTAILGLVGGFLGIYLLLVIGLIVIGAIVSCAVFRSVLDPENTAFASLRLGSQEWLVMLVALVNGLMMFALQMILAIPAGIVLVLLFSKSPAMAVGFRLIWQLLSIALVIWITLRLSMAGPMTFAERKFRLFESWSLTRGHGWALFAVGLLIGVVAVVIYLVLAVIGMVGGVALWQSAPHPAWPAAFLALPPSQWLNGLIPILALAVILGIVGGAILTPILLAPWAQAYSRLRPEADVASTFA